MEIVKNHLFQLYLTCLMLENYVVLRVRVLLLCNKIPFTFNSPHDQQHNLIIKCMSHKEESYLSLLFLTTSWVKTSNVKKYSFGTISGSTIFTYQFIIAILHINFCDILVNIFRLKIKLFHH